MGTLRLTLLRHGHAEPAAAAADDFARHLTARGRTEATGAGEWLARSGLVPERVLASSAQRTATTADLVAAACSLPAAHLHLIDEMYNASPARIWQVALQHAGPARHVLVVGHNPGISALAATLGAGAGTLPARLDLPPAGLVTATWRREAWSGVRAEDAADAQLVLP